MNPPSAPPSTTAPLCLTIKSDQKGASRFLPLLGRGFLVTCAAGDTLEEVLGRELGISPGYLQERVQTVFLNGRPIDDLRVVVIDGATVALSAAMPGLAGAVMRRGGVYAPMRGHKAETKTAAGGVHAITVKLFNMIGRELGAEILGRGIRLSARVLRDFIKGQDEDFRAQFRGVDADGRTIDPAGIVDALAANEAVDLRIELGD